MNNLPSTNNSAPPPPWESNGGPLKSRKQAFVVALIFSQHTQIQFNSISDAKTVLT